MDERLDRVAALANEVAYSAKDAESYIDGAPHLKHAALRELFARLLLDVYDAAAQYAQPPKVLDLGAGEGSVTLQFLEIGAKVTAVDISQTQLDELATKCEKHRDRLEIRCQDISDALNDTNEQFDIIALNSFLHHVPDYLSLIDKCAAKLSPHGIFFSFQDPLRYDTVGFVSKTFTDIGYFFWRLRGGAEGDVIGGIGRRLRRRRGVYLDDCFQDNAEYHMVRNGVDHLAIEKLLRDRGLECNLGTYYSTQNSLFQPIGAALGFKNTFAMIASRDPLPGRRTPSL